MFLAKHATEMTLIANKEKMTEVFEIVAKIEEKVRNAASNGEDIMIWELETPLDERYIVTKVLHILTECGYSASYCGFGQHFSWKVAWNSQI